MITILAQISTSPTFDDSGALLTADVQATFKTTATIGDQVLSGVVQVWWNGNDTTATVTASGITATYAQVTALAASIAEQERSAAPGSQAKAKADAASV